MTSQESFELMKSDGFANLLFIDATFISSIGRGVILLIGTIGPDKSLIPISYGWANSEYTEQNSKMLKEILDIISPNKISSILSILTKNGNLASSI